MVQHFEVASNAQYSNTGSACFLFMGGRAGRRHGRRNGWVHLRSRGSLQVKSFKNCLTTIAGFVRIGIRTIEGESGPQHVPRLPCRSCCGRLPQAGLFKSPGGGRASGPCFAVHSKVFVLEGRHGGVLRKWRCGLSARGGGASGSRRGGASALGRADARAPPPALPGAFRQVAASCGGSRRQLIANNARFAVLPAGRVPNLASRALGLGLRRLAGDFRDAHGYPVLLAETFVDPSRFEGTCCRASNRVCLGRTRGFSREPGGSVRWRGNGQPKEVHVYEIEGGAAQPACVP